MDIANASVAATKAKPSACSLNWLKAPMLPNKKLRGRQMNYLTKT